MNMCIPKGSIYGLLGPSGCGKTTLIHCIVGKRKLVSGELAVFGQTPGTEKSGIPGGRVGYMPQELALIWELTLKETLIYFGKIFDMSREGIRSRSEFLINLLDLSENDRLIRNLSGGQQRRVSLAAALIHEPELLILDEPTVGVDPMLRRCIWSHLLDIIRESNFQTTIVITTHYIEEARQANVIGMMRHGQLLAEGPPEELLLSYGKPTLEEVFIHLCVENENVKLTGESLQSERRVVYRKKYERDVTQTNVSKSASWKNKAMNSKKCSVRIDQKVGNNHGQDKGRKWYGISRYRMRALFYRNSIRIKRSWFVLTLLLFIPILDLTTFYIAFGHQPRDLTMAIVSEEIYPNSCGHYARNCIFYDNPIIHWQDRQNLSCQYTAHLEEHKIHPVFYDNLVDAEHAVRSGKHWGVMHFKKNYTDALIKRYLDPISGHDTSNQSDIYVSLDMSNQVVGAFIQLHISEAYQEFAQDLLTACDRQTEIAKLPIVYKAPIYGTSEPTFTDFAIPGLMLTLTYFLSVGNTGLAFILDKRDGVTDRGWVAGVTPTEVVLSFLIINFAVLIVQVIVMLIILTVVFQTHVEGSLIDCMVLLLLQGVCGMSFGLVISAFVDTEHEAMMIVIGALLCSLHLCGTIWPLEGMPDLLRYFSYTLPNTLASDALRAIMAKGWDSRWVQVDVAYAVTVTWIVLHVAISVVILRVRK